MHYTYTYNLTPSEAANATSLFAGLGVFLIVIWIFAAAVAVLYYIGLWKVFKKAGEEGWKAIIPFYNNWILFKIIGLEPALSLLMLIPLATLPMQIIAMINLSKVFNKTSGFTVGLILLSPVFMLILGTGDSKYVGVNKTQEPAPAASANQAEPAAPAPATPAPTTPVSPAPTPVQETPTQVAPTPAPAQETPAPTEPTAPAGPAQAPEQPQQNQ